MEFAVGLFLFIMGLFMLVKPMTMWRVTEAWKLITKAEPTDLYIVLIRIAGGILVIGGICAMLQM